MRKTITNLYVLLMILVGGYHVPASSSKYEDLVPRYDLSIRVLPEEKRLEVSGTVRIPKASTAREFIPLLLSDQMHDFQVDVIQPAASVGVATAEVKGKAGGRNFYFVTPPKPFPANEPILLKFKYAGGENGGFVFHIGSDGSYAHGFLSAWYPLLDAGDYTGHVGKLSFQVPSGQIVIASGKSSGSISEMAVGHQRFDVTEPAVFSFAVGKYTIARRTGNLRLAAYLLRPRQNTDEYLLKCGAILSLLEGEFGRYPFGELSMIEVPVQKDAGFFGASSPGLVFIPSAFIDAKFDYSLHGHEISHQWWGGTIGVKGDKGSEMLSEGMAQFGSLATVEHLESKEAADGYRRIGYPSIGKYNVATCNGRDIPIQSLYGYLMMTAAEGDQRLDSLSGDMAHSLANSKGFLVLDLLARTVGLRKFSQIMADFTRQHAFRAVTWEEFLSAIEAGAGSDLKWFYSQWFERTGVPEYSLAWKQVGSTVQGTITQSSPTYRATMRLRANGAGADQSVSKWVDVDGPSTQFTLKTRFKATSVEIDPTFQVPRWIPEFRRDADAIRACSGN